MVIIVVIDKSNCCKSFEVRVVRQVVGVEKRNFFFSSGVIWRLVVEKSRCQMCFSHGVRSYLFDRCYFLNFITKMMDY